ncbi:hypothetical protein GCM10010112_35340 [Actinoplanes lobatus]|uniref:Uncharacterized protein n=1 Tax=Actinoplanes lobatus TaxID=113568 RepID=A0ABQ4AXJ4_9ACTN|nr:hypothetical protein GCM10010112_35340 [Actinoplanes lobatus]GIE45754.1 hypothetical protein Alo02nite_86520 [Actinoplanes lobatus]
MQEPGLADEGDPVSRVVGGLRGGEDGHLGRRRRERGCSGEGTGRDEAGAGKENAAGSREAAPSRSEHGSSPELIKERLGMSADFGK